MPTGLAAKTLLFDAGPQPIPRSYAAANQNGLIGIAMSITEGRRRSPVCNRSLRGRSGILLQHLRRSRPPMRSAQVFISYRRDDAAGYARAIGDELATHFGADRVFIDVDDIRAGQRFGEVIERQIGASQVLLVLIGRRWQGEREGAVRRIDEPGDLVRREVAAGLANGARVIPVLLDGASMPVASQLPDDLRALAGRHALEIDNSRYADDMNRLLAVLCEALGEQAPKTPLPQARRGPGLGLRLAGVALLVGVVAALWTLGQTAGTPPRERVTPPDRSAAGIATGRPDINGMWQADVTYDWPNARYREHFDLRGDATGLHGTASFLGVPRGVLEGRVEPDGLRFVTRTTEVGGGGHQDIVHRYEARWVDGELRFVMQTEGGSTPHAPAEFVARRLAAATASATR